mgnify:CR=1 FL=1
MIRLNVFIRTTESNREELVRTAKELVAASLKDEGCVAYDLFGSATRGDVLMICETWSNAKALAAHEQAPHFTTLVPRLEQLGELKISKDTSPVSIWILPTYEELMIARHGARLSAECEAHQP